MEVAVDNWRRSLGTDRLVIGAKPTDSAQRAPAAFEVPASGLLRMPAEDGVFLLAIDLTAGSRLRAATKVPVLASL